VQEKTVTGTREDASCNLGKEEDGVFRARRYVEKGVPLGPKGGAVSDGKN